MELQVLVNLTKQTINNNNEKNCHTKKTAYDYCEI